MDKPKWYSKLIHMAVILSVVLSLMGLAVLPVAAQGPVIEVTVFTDENEYCVCTDIEVTAHISNPSAENATKVIANITWSPPSGASWVDGGNSTAPHDQWVGNITAGEWTEVTWTLHCDAPGALNITVDAIENVATRAPASASGWTEVEQWGRAELTALIFTPQEDDTFSECQEFPLTFMITNNGTAPALHVNGTIFPSDNVAIAKFGCANAGMSYTTGTLPRLDPGESYNWTVMMHCCGCDVPPLISSIHVIPNGDGYCTGRQIQDRYTYSDIVRIYQTYNVTCDAEDTKVGNNVTFTATLGDCAEPPIDWTWDFDDGNIGSGTSWSRTIVVSHNYSAPGIYNTTISVTDNLTVNGTCNTTVQVFDELTAKCSYKYPFTKEGHDIALSGTGVGGFPADMCNYTWTWDFGDNTTINGTGYSSGTVYHFYNVSLNCSDEPVSYLAVFTIQDDCLNNTANCSTNVTVYPPLEAVCDADTYCTKVGDNVTFNGTACGGIAPEACNYTWTWDFGDGMIVGGTGYGPIIVDHVYNETGNWTATFCLEDTCYNNTACCNVTVEVFPGLNLTCEGNDSTVCNPVNFTATVTGGCPTANYTWEWDFGDPFDPTPAFTQNATHTYMCTGNYTATVSVCDDNPDQPNCANCTVNVTITIEPPELYWPGNGRTVTVGCNNTVCFEWEDIGCCNYTVLIWKEIIGEKVWTVHTGKDAFACIELFELEGGWKWQVIAVDMCGEWVASDIWHFDVERDCMYADVTVTRPNGGETFTCNTTEMITWDVTEYGTVGDGLGIDQGDLVIDIYYSVAGGTWIPIAMGEENDGAYGWYVPQVRSNQCLVKVRATDAQGNVGIDVSDSVFTIECAPPPTTCTTLYEGFNLYSPPLIPDDTDIEVVTASINDTLLMVITWNGTDFLVYIPGIPASTLKTMEDGVAYWMAMNETDTLCIDGQPLPDPPALPPTYPVVGDSWNFIGYKSMVPQHHSAYLSNLWSGGLPNYSVILGFDGSVQDWIVVFPSAIGMMEPGHGYLLFATADGTIVPTI